MFLFQLIQAVASTLNELVATKMRITPTQDRWLTMSSRIVTVQLQSTVDNLSTGSAMMLICQNLLVAALKKPKRTVASTLGCNFMVRSFRLLVRLFIRSFVHSFIRLFVHSFIRSFVHSFIRSFIHSFINPFLSSFLDSFDISFF